MDKKMGEEKRRVAIRIKNLEKVFKPRLRAVRGISFDVYENEIFGLLGSNGSGKTTTLRMIATILPPTKGSISVLDLDGNHKKIRDILGYIPQQDLLYQDLSVFDNLDLFSRAYKIDKKERIARIEELILKFELTPYRNSVVSGLSGGYKKRLSIAIAIIHKPKIIVADEITIGLDPDLRLKIWDLLRELKKEATIIFTTHYLEEAEELCDRIVLMDLGEIIIKGTPSEILKKEGVSNLNQVFQKLVTKRIKNV